jgi:hypothetical protein
VCTLWKWILKNSIVPEDVLEEASAAKYQMMPTKSELRYQKELEIFTQWQTEKRIKEKDENVCISKR